MTVTEAAACGIPSVTFGLGGTAEIIEHEKNGLIAGQSESDLVNSLERLLTDDNLVDQMGSAARSIVESRYGWNIISSKFNEFFAEIIANYRQDLP
jgi:glycosyltransferase involved in cell wall biosynthesis